MREQDGEKIFNSAKKGDTAFFMRDGVICVGKVSRVENDGVGIGHAEFPIYREHGEYSDSFDALAQIFGLPPITDETELRGIGGRIIALADVHGYDDALQSALFLVGKRLGEE